MLELLFILQRYMFFLFYQQIIVSLQSNRKSVTLNNMMKIRLFLLLCLTFSLWTPVWGSTTVRPSSLPADDNLTLSSPDGRMELTFHLLGGTPHYELKRDGKQVVSVSPMGFELEWRDDLMGNFVLKDVERGTFD